MGKYGKIMGKLWENIGKLWETYGKIMEYQPKRWDVDLVVLGFAQLRNLLLGCWLVFFPSMTPKMPIFSTSTSYGLIALAELDNEPSQGPGHSPVTAVVVLWITWSLPYWSYMFQQHPNVYFRICKSCLIHRASFNQSEPHWKNLYGSMECWLRTAFPVHGLR